MAEKDKKEIQIQKNDLKSLDAISLINNNDTLDYIANSSLVPANTKKENIISAIITGNEFGITPMRSVLLMKYLTPGNAPKIHKGTSLGMDIVESVRSIYIIDGETTVGANALMGVLRRNGIDFEMVRDCEPIFRTKILNGKFGGNTLTEEIKNVIGVENLYETDSNTTQHYIDGIISKNKEATFYINEIIDWVTEIHFTREGFKEHKRIFKYSQALESGIINDKKGGIKRNWKDKKTMMQHKALGLGARFIAGDIIGQTYTPGEASEISKDEDIIMQDKNDSKLDDYEIIEDNN